MKILLISHAYVAKENLRKPELLGRYPGFEIGVVRPQQWLTSHGMGIKNKESRTEDEVNIYSLPTLLSGNSGKYFYEPLGLYRVVKQFKPDIIHLEEEPWTPAALEVVVIPRINRARLCNFTWENLDLKLGFWQRAIERFVFRNSALIIAGSSEAKGRVRKRGFKGPVEVLPQFGVDTDHFKPLDASSTDFTVGFIGRFVKEKGIRTLLEAVAKLPPDVKLLLVSSSPKLPSEFEALAIKLEIHDRVKIVSGVSHQELPKYINQMDVFVLPSETTPTWKEQFGRVLIEAMACKVPVIGSSSGAIPEVIGDAGLIFEEKNADALASKIESLRSSENLRQELAEKGYQRVLKNFTFEKIAEETARLYTSITTS